MSPPMKIASKGKRGAEEEIESRSFSNVQILEVVKVSGLQMVIKKQKNDKIDFPDLKEDESRCSNFKEELLAAHIMSSSNKIASKGKGAAEEETDIQSSFKVQIIEVVKMCQLKNVLKEQKITSIEFPGIKKSESKCSNFGGESDTHVKSNEESGMKILFVGNLPPEVIEDDLKEFFKRAGEVIKVQFVKDNVGSFKGFGHVEFVTEADALKALRMNGYMLFGRPLIVDLARDMGSYDNLHEEKESKSYRIGAHDSDHCVFVKGFGKSLNEDQIRNSLVEHFRSCGEIFRVSIPQDNKTGRSKGFAYLLFSDQAMASKALELNGTKLGGYTLKVQLPTSKSNTHDGSCNGKQGRKERICGQGMGFGEGGRGRGRGQGRGRPGAFFIKSATTASNGRKTTFADNI